MITVYGIKQCDTCRRALKWLAGQGIPHAFHDLRVDGLDGDLLRRWFSSPFAEQLVNRRSTTWRSLSDEEKSSTGEALIALLLAHPTLVKRPVFERNGAVLAVGFKADGLEAALEGTA